ncbi:hypothetical protein XENOCAPTIV_005087 [Xenoophorus captivus]|uniref:Uncharacterized protein n=1 Tax=Xenoophorus captivus TaxID=1517983 RepID=A0ABV0S1R7_9TELE
MLPRVKSPPQKRDKNNKNSSLPLSSAHSRGSLCSSEESRAQQGRGDDVTQQRRGSSLCWANLWHACAVSPCILPTISKGYKLLFAMTPPSALFIYQLGFSTCPGRQNCIPSRQKSDQSNTK